MSESSESTVWELVESVPTDLVTLSADVDRHGVGKMLKKNSKISSHLNFRKIIPKLVLT